MRRPDRPDNGEIVWLVQRRERNERGEFGNDLVVQKHRRRIVGPSMNNAVPDGRDISPLQPRHRDPHHRPRRGRVIESFF